MFEYLYHISVLAEQNGTGEGPAFQNLFFMMAAIAVAFYLIILRPQSKERKERERQLSALGKGDKIVTIGGIHGQITRMGKGDQTLEIEVAKNTRIVVNRGAVATVVRSSGKGGEKVEAEELE